MTDRGRRAARLVTAWHLLFWVAVAVFSLRAALTSKTALDSAVPWILGVMSLAVIITRLLLRSQTARRQAIMQLVAGVALFLVSVTMLLMVGRALAIGRAAALVVLGVVVGAFGAAMGTGIVLGGVIRLRGSPRFER